MILPDIVSSLRTIADRFHMPANNVSISDQTKLSFAQLLESKLGSTEQQLNLEEVNSMLNEEIEKLSALLENIVQEVIQEHAPELQSFPIKIEMNEWGELEVNTPQASGDLLETYLNEHPVAQYILPALVEQTEKLSFRDTDQNFGWIYQNGELISQIQQIDEEP